MTQPNYGNACEFLAKADYEGGVADMVLGYGVGEGDVPPHVYVQVRKLEQAYEDLRAALGIWHGKRCLSDEDCPGVLS